LASLQAQEFPEGLFEIIVVDDGSDPPAAVPDDVRVVPHGRPIGSNAARNTGARAALSDLLIFVDDDIEAPPGWLSEFVAGAARHPDALCFGGRAILRLEGSPSGVCARCLERWRVAGSYGGEDEVEGPARAGWVMGVNMGVRRTALDKVGLFDESLPIYYEEIEWQDRVKAMGGEIVYLPDALLWHRRNAAAASLHGRLTKAYRRGRGEMVAYSLHTSRARLARALLGPPARAPLSLFHACRYRCGEGLVSAVHQAGKFVGTTEGLLRSRGESLSARS